MKKNKIIIKLLLIISVFIPINVSAADGSYVIKGVGVGGNTSFTTTICDCYAQSCRSGQANVEITAYYIVNGKLKTQKFYTKNIDDLKKYTSDYIKEHGFEEFSKSFKKMSIDKTKKFNTIVEFVSAFNEEPVYTEFMSKIPDFKLLEADNIKGDSDDTKVTSKYTWKEYKEMTASLYIVAEPVIKVSLITPNTVDKNKAYLGNTDLGFTVTACDIKYIRQKGTISVSNFSNVTSIKASEVDTMPKTAFNSAISELKNYLICNEDNDCISKIKNIVKTGNATNPLTKYINNWNKIYNGTTTTTDSMTLTVRALANFALDSKTSSRVGPGLKNKLADISTLMWLDQKIGKFKAGKSSGASSWDAIVSNYNSEYGISMSGYGVNVINPDVKDLFEPSKFCEYDEKNDVFRLPEGKTDQKDCCEYSQLWKDTTIYNNQFAIFSKKDNYKNVCASSCNITDFINITNQADWGDDPIKPASNIKIDKSSVINKTSGEYENLMYCCNFDNYSEEELKKINDYALRLKNPTNGTIKIEAKKFVEKKCGPTTVYCGEDAYTKMKMVENNEILLSKAKTTIGAVEYNLDYCCDINNWNYKNNEKINKLTTESDLEKLLFKVCDIPKSKKCTWDYLNQSKTRYYYKDGNSNNTNPDNISDCCDYNEIKDSLPNNMKITDFHQQQAYKDVGCGGCEYKVVNGEYKIVLTDKLKKQGKTEKYCCDNNENQWEGEDNPQYISFKKNTTYMAQLGCAQAACSWDKNKDEKTRYSNGVDCCVATNYETNDIINGLKKEGINISSNPTQSQIISKFKESTHYKNMKCNACTPESINSTNHACCTQPEMYDNSYRSEFRKYSVDEKEGLTKFLKANYNSIYESYCKTSTPPECTIDTYITCPNCDTPSANGFISGKSYDTVEYQDGKKDSTSINDINEAEKKCIVSENKFLNEDIGNKYCKVYCTERIEYDYPEIVKSVEAGRKYPLGVASITTVKTCRINGIDEATFKSDLNAKAAEIKNAYDDYLKYKQAKKDAKIVTKAYDAKDKNNTCDCVNNASTTINGTTVSRNCCSQISTKISTVTTHTETLASTIDKSNLDMNTFRSACSQKNGRQSGNKCYYCDDGKKPNSNNKCEGPEVTSCSSPGSEYTLVNSTTCEYAYCSTIDNTKYGYQKVEKYEYGVDTKKTNQEGNICETPENKDKMYTVTYPKNEEEAWNKVNVLQGEFDAIIKQYKECFDIPNTILNLDDYDFNINVDYSQGDYSHSDKMEKSLVSSQVFEDDRVKSSNRISKSYGNIKVKVTRDKYNKEQLVIDNIYQGDLSKTIYSVSVQRQYKYTLTTGYTYINKGKPQSVTEKLQELQQIQVAAHLPVSYDYTENGNITLSTTLDSDNARSDLALCTVDQNSDYELSCPFSVYDRLLLEPGGVLPVYRPIILSNPFPDKDGNGRNTGVNWCYENNCTNDPSINKTVYNYITNNRGRTEENVYNLLPLYTIKLTPADVQNIRNYNKATNYNDFRLICNNGKYCESIFLRGIYTLGYNEQSDIYKVSGVINDISNLVDKSRSCALNQNLSNCNYDDYFSASLGGD